MLRPDVHVGVGAEEARQVPVLVLAAPLAAPQFAPELGGQVVFHPLGARGDPLDELGRNPRFLLQLAQRSRPGLLARVDPALRHLPGLVGVIDPRPDEDLARAVQKHDADPAAVTLFVSGHGPRHCEQRSCEAIQFDSREEREGAKECRGIFAPSRLRVFA